MNVPFHCQLHKNTRYLSITFITFSSVCIAVRWGAPSFAGLIYILSFYTSLPIEAPPNPNIQLISFAALEWEL